MDEKITCPTTKEEFLQKWERELAEVTELWNLANRKDWGEVSLIEGKRMSAISEMLSDYKDTHNG